MRTHARWVVLLLVIAVAGCKSSSSGKASASTTPPPEPVPVTPASEPAPTPAPEPAPAPGPDRARITKMLDEIDGHLAELAKGHKGNEHRDAIEKLVEQLEQPLAGFDAGAAPYAKLKEHAKKFHDAQMAKKTKDANGHRAKVEEAVKELRATLK